MSGDAFSITQEQVDEILASAHAIGRLMEYLAEKGGADNQTTVHVVETNLASIRLNLRNLPKVSSN